VSTHFFKNFFGQKRFRKFWIAVRNITKIEFVLKRTILSPTSCTAGFNGYYLVSQHTQTHATTVETFLQITCNNVKREHFDWSLRVLIFESLDKVCHHGLMENKIEVLWFCNCGLTCNRMHCKSGKLGFILCL